MPTNTTVNSSSSAPSHCADSTAVLFIYFSFTLAKVLFLLPLSVLTLGLGCRRWRQQRSFATTSHSDVFAFQVAAAELMFAVGSAVYLSGYIAGVSEVLSVGMYILNMCLPGHMCFHILTCVERYLAVVHPVVYLRLRQSGGVKIRNISIAFVWLMCFVWSGAGILYSADAPMIPFVCLLVLSLVAVSFCSLSVLCVLIRPGPGKVERVDQSKKRAFYTIMVITGVLWLWFVGLLVCVTLYKSPLLRRGDGCLVMTISNWLSLPSSLVLPLLFLQRAGKLPWSHPSRVKTTTG